MDVDAENLFERLRSYRLRGRSQPLQHIGLHRAIQEGEGIDVSSLSPYYPGEDLRYLDWRVYARDGRLVLRRHETERQRQSLILLDRSLSMTMADKRETAERLAVALAWVATSSCRVRFGVLGEPGIHSSPLLGPRRSAGVHVHQLAEDLKRLLQSNGASLSHANGGVQEAEGPVASSLALLLKQGIFYDQVVMISDLFERKWPETLHALASMSADPIVLALQSETDRAPTGEGAWSLRDVESGKTRQADLTPARLLAYRRRWEAWQAEVNETCRRRGIRFLLLPAEEGLNALLLHHLIEKGLLVPAYAS